MFDNGAVNPTSDAVFANNKNIRIVNKYGETPLELAIENGNFEVFDQYNEKILKVKESFKKHKKYIKGDNNTIIDNENEIAWQTTLSNKKMNLQEAKEYCLNLDLAFYNDWKIPTINELSTIINLKKYKPATDTKLFPNTKSFFYWSISPTDIQNQYKTVDFNYGDILPKNSNIFSHIRCVRSMN